MRYQRAVQRGGTYFFTVNMAERRSDVLVRHITDLRAPKKGERRASVCYSGNGGATRIPARDVVLATGRC